MEEDFEWAGVWGRGSASKIWQQRQWPICPASWVLAGGVLAVSSLWPCQGVVGAMSRKCLGEWLVDSGECLSEHAFVLR